MSGLASPVSGGVATPSVEVRDTGRVIVQVVKAWPGEGAWPFTLTPYLDASSAEEAWAPALGSATFSQAFGSIRQPNLPGFRPFGMAPTVNRAAAGADPDASLLGQYVRLSKSSETGSVSYDGGTYEPFWWGVVTGVEYDNDGAPDTNTGGRAIWSCAGLGYLLEKMRPIRGHELNAAGTIADPGEMLVFNATPEGDRSGAKHYVNDTLQAYIHDRLGTGQLWTAGDVVEYLLNAHARQNGSSIIWGLTGQTDALDYSETWDLRGLTLWQAVVRILNARRGASFRLIVEDGDPVLHVTTTLATAITVEDGTIPINSEATDVTFSGDMWKDGVQITENEGPVYDEIMVQGDHHLVTCTLQYKPDGTGDLVKGWDTALEASWTASTKDTKYEHVWRRFKLRDGFDFSPDLSGGDQIFNSQLTYPHTPFTASDANTALYGDGGLTGGGYFYDSTVPAWSSATVIFERQTALYEGYDYVALMGIATTLPAGSVDVFRSRLPPLVFFSSNSGTAWSDISTTYTVRCEDQRAAIVLGNGITEAAAIKAAINVATARLAFTVSFRVPMRLATSWKRSRSSWPRTYPRRLIIPSDFQYWRILDETYVGISSTTPKKIANSSVLLTERAQATQLLAACLPWYSLPDRTLAWTETGTVDTDDTYAPGVLVTSAVLGDKSVTINGVITRRTWDLSEDGWSTSYRVERIKPDLDALL